MTTCILLSCGRLASAAATTTTPDSALAGLGASARVAGAHHAFSITAPAGWILDSQSGRANGMQVVFYRRGSTWQTAPTVMYANADDMADSETVSVESFIKDDIRSFRERDPKVVIRTGVPLRTRGSLDAEVREFLSDAHGSYEAVAYLGAPRSVITLVLSARTLANFQAAFADFRRLVASYQLEAGGPPGRH